MIQNWFLELRRRNRLLADSGLLYFFVFIGLAILPLFDSRELMGVSVWNKPLKFFISTTILFWTVGWIMADIHNRKAVSFISRGIFLILSAELVLISYQAIQGKISHFNISNPIDGAIFGTMGVLIFLNSLFFIYLLFLISKEKTLPKGYKLGIQLGLIIFLIGGYEGYLMAGRLSHTVGATDGQEGYFLLGWAKAYGDLRIFHFLGLHALQVLSLAGWYFFKNDPWKMLVTGVVYFLMSSGILWISLQGKSLF
jgi:uncharacterized membrane protein (DUF485 family)